MFARFLPFLALLLLAGCAGMLPDKAPTTPQGVIDEANIYLTAAHLQVRDNLRNRIMGSAEAEPVLAKLNEYGHAVDEAQRLLDAGQGVAAMDKAKVVRTAVIYLHRRLAAKAAEARKEP